MVIAAKSFSGQHSNQGLIRCEKSAIDALRNEHLTNVTAGDVSPKNEGPPGEAIRTCDGHSNLRGHTWLKWQMLDATQLTKLIVIFRWVQRNSTRVVQWSFNVRKDLYAISSFLGRYFQSVPKAHRVFRKSWGGREILNCLMHCQAVRRCRPNSWQIHEESCKCL